ncbi:MAG: hypothetical protein E6H05_03940 [Bacillati bacterium ANGP1]|uniref:Outer membrane protein beta-barrel domain-containing protein n=1 Tax=Candidatus Segetimicrobium genomatis TaxID=2569760 RepID=A0A537IYF0_9BACT|nr:MAG: hypothetical protein E6H05_03940 [Terrabacteria group bacterium ANGP1]
MRHFSLTALCAAVLAAPVAAQLSPISLDASVGAKGGAQRAAVSAWHPLVHLAGRLHLGLGARVSAYGGDPIDYTNRGTVQGRLASSVPIDPAVYALNGAVFGKLDLTNLVALGANLDVIGVATGPTRTAGSLSEKPQAFSYFRYGSGDHGALNSEFFVSLRVAPRVRVRGGASHYVTNYTVTDTAAVGAPSSRYQKFQTVPFIAVRLQL